MQNMPATFTQRVRVKLLQQKVSRQRPISIYGLTLMPTTEVTELDHRLQLSMLSLSHRLGQAQWRTASWYINASANGNILVPSIPTCAQIDTYISRTYR